MLEEEVTTGTKDDDPDPTAEPKKPATIPEEGTEEFDNFDWQSEADKRGAKSVLLESKRVGGRNKTLNDENEKLKKQIEAAQSSPQKPAQAVEQVDAEIENYKKKLKGLGYDDDFIDAQIELVEKRAERKAGQLTEAKFKDIEPHAYASAKEAGLERFAGEDKIKKANIEKFKKEIDETFKKMFHPKHWGKDEAVAVVYGTVMSDNIDKLTSKTKKDPILHDVPGEPDNIPASIGNGGGGGAVTDNTVKAYCEKNKLNHSDPEVRKSIRTALTTKARAEKIRADQETAREKTLAEKQ